MAFLKYSTYRSSDLVLLRLFVKVYIYSHTIFESGLVTSNFFVTNFNCFLYLFLAFHVTLTTSTNLMQSSKYKF